MKAPQSERKVRSVLEKASLIPNLWMQKSGMKERMLVAATLRKRMTSERRAKPGQSFSPSVSMCGASFAFACFFTATEGRLLSIFGTAQRRSAAVATPQTAKSTVPSVPQAVRAAAATSGPIPKPMLPPTEKIPMPVALRSDVRLTSCAATGWKMELPSPMIVTARKMSQ